MSIGKNIAFLRKEKGMTQTELGDLLGVSNQAVSKWESEMTSPDITLLPDIARVLDVSLDGLYSIEKKDEQAEGIDASVKGADEKILNITVKDVSSAVDIKVRIPCEALKSIVNGCVDDEDSEGIDTLIHMLDGDITGTLVDVDTGEQKVKIFVEEYEN